MTFQLSSEVVLDSRRAVWLPEDGVLAVADLHLGYAWAHRLSGQLMPITPMHDTLRRLEELQADYQPAEIIVLGDIVHTAMAIPILEEEIRALFEGLSPRTQLTFVTGNHDRDLQKVLKEWLLPIQLTALRQIGKTLFLHGDEAAPAGKVNSGSRVLMGHEHPAISISDGVTSSQKCPCFLVSESVLVLPAFSTWAAGSNIRTYPPASPIARDVRFTHAIAICGERLLPIRLA